MILLTEQHSQVFDLKEFKELEPFDLISCIFFIVYSLYMVLCYIGEFYTSIYYFKRNPPISSCTLSYPPLLLFIPLFPLDIFASALMSYMIFVFLKLP